MKTSLKIMMLAAAVIATSSAAYANSDVFSTLPSGTSVSNQFAGVVYSLEGGSVTGSPSNNSFGNQAIGNSPTGDYPTSNGVNLAFTLPVSDLSFTFSNFGENDLSFYEAFDGATIVDSGNIGGSAYADGFTTVDVSGSGITDLVVDNGENGNQYWEFGIARVDFTPTPEPESFMLLGTGLAGLAGLIRLKIARKA